jgi:hypothetical protein
MKNIFYVIYDNDKNVTAITREFSDGDNYFPIEAYKVKDFILGTKSIHSYYVKHNSLDNYFLEEKKFAQSEQIYKDIYEIKESDDKNNLTIFYNKIFKKWKFVLSEETKLIIENDQHLKNLKSKNLKFYISLKSQHNFLIRTIEFKIEDLINDSAEFDFFNKYEHTPDVLKLFTKKYFSKIGIKYV